MKKNRNAFFAESNYQSYNGNIPNQNYQTPYQASGNFFYQGPMPNYNTNNNGFDVESRIAKIERQLNRIDYRLSKLESATNIVTTEEIDSNNTNMYML